MLLTKVTKTRLKKSLKLAKKTLANAFYGAEPFPEIIQLPSPDASVVVPPTEAVPVYLQAFNSGLRFLPVGWFMEFFREYRISLFMLHPSA